jgi:hypothetical protein
MGWASGSDIAIDMIESISKNVNDIETKRAIYRDLISTLSGNDWDTKYEAAGYDSDFDEVLEEMYPKDDD